MNEAILTAAVQHFLRARIDTAPAALALQKSPFPEVSPAELANQLDGMRRCRKKLPLWFETAGIYYPSLLAIEQSSSALTAHYKSELITSGSSVIDLTGGFGVDSYYFAQRAARVVHCEINESLSAIAAQNARQLQAKNIEFLAKDGLEYLRSTDEVFDFIYIDPSRRVKQQKVFKLSDCEPDVVKNSSLLKQKGKTLIIKAAPLLDIQAAINELADLSAIYIISVRNECKELLFVIDEKKDDHPITFHCAALNGPAVQVLEFDELLEKTSHPSFQDPEKYLYEPDAALLKAGCFRYTAVRFGLSKLHQHTHLYTSKELNKDFIGRSFEIETTEAYSDFKKNKKPLQGNVSTRNFPLKPEELKKRHKIKDGGNRYLFFCTGPDNQLLVVSCKKVD
ncbi:class I SAM-dependent methyltransferase [Olivibacter sp. XZL3]|uniref:class I SAM-dependent methyltransferase n=1 Tax=Olivibacter sp. XZL3 TaxID=1735116 RepID=UPI00106617BF|nr:class I SAM-dependent methyltransferase [Olivibacter sp. XZL3]